MKLGRYLGGSNDASITESQSVRNARLRGSWPLAALSALLALLAILAFASTARTAFPGQNGKIAYTQRGPGLGSIYTVQPDGSDRHLVANGLDDAFFSATGRRLVALGPKGYVVMRANGHHRRRIPHSAGAFSGSLTPSGKSLIFAHGLPADLFLMRLDGSHRRRITRTSKIDERDPVFSPTGDKIAFETFCHIAVMKTDGHHRHHITNPPSDTCDTRPDFSPDGKRLVFEYQDDGERDIYVVRTDGRHLRRLKVGNRFDDEDHPAFSPTGRRIVFDRRPRGRGARLTTIHVDGSHLRNLPHPVFGHTPDWGVRP